MRKIIANHNTANEHIGMQFSFNDLNVKACEGYEENRNVISTINALKKISPNTNNEYYLEQSLLLRNIWLKQKKNTILF